MRFPWRKEDWDYIEFHRSRWPEGITSWTYRRRSHPIMWFIFGNDADGCTPWVHGKQWTWFRWWLRNRVSNPKWYVIGLSVYKEPQAVGDAAYPKSQTLERKFWFGETGDDAFVISFVRDTENKRNWWRPYIRIHLPFNLFFHWGWKPNRGNMTAALKKRG